MMSAWKNLVFHIEKGERVTCYFCNREGDHTEYERGEAFLASAGHSPRNGDANFICKEHLDSDAVIQPSWDEVMASRDPTRLIL